ncbi:putative DNA-directed RNA polymerase III subunit rpc6 [Hypsizygus marmoreus]|uniref:DNA-directed RNA polymerase III subunit rpc6 n=1 Tax=Hypsizygus marmoreus TaxID=39966 RepID=A0A369JUD1_HYPMA|nr:putative DNA-directed RNA polymerase III subunit rpc6 [Hypsizygus marmoreus]
MSKRARPPNELESKLHQAALSAPKKELSARQAESIVPESTARNSALNFLLGVGLFKTLKDAKGAVLFRAVTQNELAATKDLSGEENLVLGHIKASSTEGIWTKHLKAKTNLHQTIIDRCLKTLTQKRLIKRVPSVQHPTRKIYMLEGLEPSVALTGGPWYTDNELDTEFIQHLTDACLKFIRDISFPKRRGEGSERALFGISNSPNYPSAQQIRNSLRKARLTETDLSVEHVEMLLNVLVLDGEVERLPSFGTSMWDANVGGDESEDEAERSSKRKRKRSYDDNGSKRKRKRSTSGDDENGSDGDASSQKKSKRKRAKDATDSEQESDDVQSRKKKKKKRSRSDSEGNSSSDEEEDSSRKNKAKRRKSKRSRDSSDSESSSDESEHRSRRGKSSKAMKRSPSPFQNWDNLDTSGGGSVYRAIRQERLAFGASEAPCGQCPSFEFCKDGGPVNPRECVYFGDWLVGGTIPAIEDSL